MAVGRGSKRVRAPAYKVYHLPHTTSYQTHTTALSHKDDEQVLSRPLAWSPLTSFPALAPLSPQEGQDTKSLKPYVGTVMTATLSFDRRVIDEAIAGQFLQVREE